MVQEDGTAPSQRKVIDLYKKDLDMGLLRENLKLTPGERIKKFGELSEFVESFRGCARRAEREAIIDPGTGAAA